MRPQPPAPGTRPAGRSGPAQIWVESPLQMLSAVESFHAGLLGESAVLVPRDGSASLARTGVELLRLGLPDGLRLAPSASTVPSPPTRGTWVIGDAFSGQVQRRIVLSSSRSEIVLVDDGLATVHLLDLLTRDRPTPLVRARARLGRARTALALLTALRLRQAARTGRLTVFSAFDVNEGLRAALCRLGVRLVHHDFGWLRSQPDEDTTPQPLVLLGTSLVANGLVHADPYVAWVRELARHQPVAYYPHRREDAATLQPLADTPGVTVYDVGAPAEVRLRGLGPRHRVASLPSTAVTSLRLLLGSAGTAIDALAVPDDWWTERAGASLRAHLTLTVSGVARPLEAFRPVLVPTPSTARPFLHGRVREPDEARRFLVARGRHAMTGGPVLG